MRSVRLLPIVILAAVALLVFKGIGLLTTGSYVLTGTTVVMASSGGEGEAEAGGAEDGVPHETTMTDSSPTLDDGAPTLGAPTGKAAEGSHADDHAAPAADAAPAHGAPEAAPASPPAEGAGGHGEAAAAPAGEVAPAAHEPAHVDEAAAGQPAVVSCPGVDRSLTRHEIGEAISDAAKGQAISGINCPPDPRAEGVPATQDSSGNTVPLQTAASGGTTDAAILERLAQRRAELEKRESEIGMREALVAAAEKRIEERTAKLEELEKQIGALVDQKKGLEEAEFKGLVTMYEGMKPKDAAAIFDALDLKVLIKLARSMNPRKMSPIMAAMNPDRAQQVTVQLAAAEASEEATAPAPGDLASLPQIVGQ